MSELIDYDLYDESKEVPKEIFDIIHKRLRPINKRVLVITTPNSTTIIEIDKSTETILEDEK